MENVYFYKINSLKIQTDKYMGFLSSLKKLFFATESVTKSAVDKSVDFARDKASELGDQAAGLKETVIEKAQTAKDNLGDMAGKSWEKAKDIASDVSEKADSFIDKAMDTAIQAKDSLAENEWVQKAGDMAENVGSKVLETGKDALDKAGEISENVGAKVMEASDKTWDKISEVKDTVADKAKEIADQIGQKLDETVKKAEDYMAEENAKPKQEFSDKDLNVGGSLLKEKDDFFAKADQYAKGDYDSFSEGKITITESKETPSKTPSKIAGQEDLDGDGNDQIDDAIVVQE